MSDEIFFESAENKILVSKNKFVVGNETYIIKNITSFKSEQVTEEKLNKLYSKLYLIGGIITLAMAIQTAKNSGFFLILTLFFIFISIYWKKLPNTYRLVIRASGGEIQVFASPDKQLIDKISDSLGKAIANS